MTKKAKKTISFDVKSSILRLMKRTLDVSKQNKTYGKNPLCFSCVFDCICCCAA